MKNNGFSRQLVSCGHLVHTRAWWVYWRGGVSTCQRQASGTVAPSVTLPLIAPSIESGKNDFQQYCASCHSQSNLIKAGAIPNVNLISTDWLKGTSPGQMFTALTAGKPNRGMPAFDSLSVSDRWDLVAYLLSLVSSQNDQAGGRLIYQNMCQSCHGGDGSGSGVQSAAQGLATVDWQNDPLFAEYSNQDLYDIIHSGNEHGMDQFAVMLSDRQLWSMVAISRALSISAPIASVSLPQTTSGQLATSQNQGFFTIKGKVTNGSGGDLHDLNTVNLDISADGQTLYQMVSTVLADNTFQFVLVPIIRIGVIPQRSIIKTSCTDLPASPDKACLPPRSYL